jgi:hypothetical protein
MYQRRIVLIGIVLVAAAPLFAELRSETRIDAGVIVPFVSSEGVLPFGDMGFYQMLGSGSFRVGVGVRGLSLVVIENLFWPALAFEVDFRSLIFSIQMGGGFIGMVGMSNSFFAGALFIPDVSCWFKLTERWRLGLGAITMLSPSVSAMDFFGKMGRNILVYAGFKYSIRLVQKG